MRTMILVFVLVVLPLASAAGQSTEISFNSKLSLSEADKSVKIPGLLFKPEGAGPHPAVVLLHHCGGPYPHVTEDWPDFLTGLGYVVITIDSYAPRRITGCAFMKGLNRVTVQGLDALGLLDYLATQPLVDIDNVAVMGFSSGAININRIIASRFESSPEGRKFKAAIAVYGHCKKLYSSRSTRDTPVLEIVAENDPDHAKSCIAAEDVDGIDVFVIEGAYHGFDELRNHGQSDPFGAVMEYSGSATDKARELTKAFLGHHLLGLQTKKIWKQARPEEEGPRPECTPEPGRILGLKC